MRADSRLSPMRGFFAAVAMATTLGACATGGGGGMGAPETHAPLESLPVTPEAFVDTVTGAYVLVDLDLNHLSFMYGDRVLWDAPIGTGTGLRLEGEDGEWHFSTPRGVFQVKLKEEMPIWYLPDWYFIEKDLPIPPQDSPSRRLPNQLGVAAVYIGQEIAIHGTDRPELLGQRVSHGCIRLENRFAQRLFHNVQVGTPVVIIGGEHLDDEPPGPTTDPGSPTPRPPDPLAGLSSDVILDRLTALIENGDTTGAWVPLTSRLITRAHREDATAMRGLLSLAGTSSRPALDLEFGTFLADLFARGSWVAVVSLARIDEEARLRATRAIVEATMALYGGSIFDPGAPWPTRRVHDSALGPEGRSGWNALAAAEDAHRLRLTGRIGEVDGP